MKLYSGLDLHSSNMYLAIDDEIGKRLFKRRLPNDRELILSTLKYYKNDIVGIVVAFTYKMRLKKALDGVGVRASLISDPTNSANYWPLRALTFALHISHSGPIAFGNVSNMHQGLALVVRLHPVVPAGPLSQSLPPLRLSPVHSYSPPRP